MPIKIKEKKKHLIQHAVENNNSKGLRWIVVSNSNEQQSFISAVYNALAFPCSKDTFSLSLPSLAL